MFFIFENFKKLIIIVFLDLATFVKPQVNPQKRDKKLNAFWFIFGCVEVLSFEKNLLEKEVYQEKHFSDIK